MSLDQRHVSLNYNVLPVNNSELSAKFLNLPKIEWYHLRHFKIIPRHIFHFTIIYCIKD